jgi:tRNA dimethylallyltransferase
MEGIPHYLIDIKDPNEPFSVAEFQELVRNRITEISSRGKLPIIVGGTGLYIQAVLYDYHFSAAPTNEPFRKNLALQAEIEGNQFLYDQLLKLDPISAKKIHPNNTRRVIRALEVFHCTGKTMSEWQQSQEREPLYHSVLIGLTMDREQLYKRINERVDSMIDEGLVDEVKGLYQQGLGHCQSIQAIGYKELFEYLDGKVTLEVAVENLKQNSRHYAKRQLTWFRNKMDVKWYDMTNINASIPFTKKIDEISTYIEGKLERKSNT